MGLKQLTNINALCYLKPCSRERVCYFASLTADVCMSWGGSWCQKGIMGNQRNVCCCGEDGQHLRNCFADVILKEKTFTSRNIEELLLWLGEAIHTELWSWIKCILYFSTGSMCPVSWCGSICMNWLFGNKLTQFLILYYRHISLQQISDLYQLILGSNTLRVFTVSLIPRLLPLVTERLERSEWELGH